MEERLTKKEAQNWLKCMFATYTTRDVMEQLADLGFKELYTQIRSDMRAKNGILETTACSSCSNISNQCHLCSEIGIRIWDNHRFKKAKLKGPSWGNTDSTKWCTTYWELAKCYMPPTGYRDKQNANSTDFNGIINAIYNCTWMQRYFSDDLSKDANIFTKAREEVNELRHLQDTHIDDGAMSSFFDCLLNLLNDPSHLHSFMPAVDARTYLKQLQQDTLPLSKTAIESTLKKIYENQKEEFRGRLIEFYTTTKKSVSVSPLRDGLDKPILDVYVQPKLSLVTLEKDGSRKKTEKAVDKYKALLFKDEKLHSRVFLQGEPGVGKTTFLTKLALDWCDAVSVHNPDHKSTFSDVDTLKEFQFLFHISLRDATDQREVIEMIKTQIIHMIYTDNKRVEIVELSQKILERETCILTLDGLNEWDDRLHKYVIPLLAHCHTKCVSVITSRPWKMADERIKDSELNCLIEIEGIMDSEELAKKIINSLQTSNLKTHTEFMTYVNKRKLRHFLTTPWLETLLVNFWMNYKVSGSLCEINCILLDILFKNANAKRGYFLKGNSFRCLSKTRFIQQQIDVFNALASAAFNLTFSSKNNLVFTELDLLNYMSEVQLEFCLRAGVLTKRYSSTIADQDAQFSFVHETVQEFLAAYYIANSNQDILEHFQTESQLIVLEMSETIIYLCGLECKKANRLLHRLVDVKFLDDINHGLSSYVKGYLENKEILACQTDNNTQRNVLKVNNEMDYNTRCYALSVLFQRMIIAGYIEAKASGEKEICLKCMDFTFNTYLKDSDSNALKMLLLSNTSDVRSLILECDILQTSELLTVIQQSKQSLKRVKMTVTPQINKELYQTSIQELNYIGKIDVASFSCVLPSLSQLTFLEIDDSTFLEDIVLPYTIQYICLCRCTCSAVFLRRLLVRLSSLQHVVRFNLEYVRLIDCSENLFQPELLSSDMQDIALIVTGKSDLYNLIRGTSIGFLGIMPQDLSSTSEILHTLNKLATLCLFPGTYTGRFELKLPASLRCIRLVMVECSSEWLCSLLIALSSFYHFVKCECRDVVLQSSKETRGEDSHTHESDLRSEILSHDLSNIEIFVCNTGSKELFELLRYTSIRGLFLKTAECVSLASEIIYTLYRLTKLYLSGTYTGRCDLELPVSLRCIYLQEGIFSTEWLCSLLITLSLLDHPVECWLFDVVLQSSGETRGDDSHTHVPEVRSEILSHDMSNIRILSDVNYSSKTNVSDLQSEMVACDMSNIELRVTNFQKEQFEILRGTSIKTLQLTAFDDVSLTFVTQNTLPAFKEIRLKGTYSTGFIPTLPPNLELMILQKGSCSSDWLYSLLTQLSTLGHSVRVLLNEYVVLQRRGSSEDNSEPSIRDADLSNVTLAVRKECPGLYETLPTMRITSLSMTQIKNADMLLQTLPLLTHLQQLRIFLERYDVEIKLPESIKYVFIIFKALSPLSLQCFVHYLSTTKHGLLCKLLFRVEENDDEYMKIKQELLKLKSFDVQRFELVYKQDVVDGTADFTLASTADDGEDDHEKKLLRIEEEEYVFSKTWIHFFKIRLNILCPDNSGGSA